MSTLHINLSWTKTRTLSSSSRRWESLWCVISLLKHSSWCINSVFLWLISGSSTEASFSGPECNSASIFPGTYTEFHHSTGTNISLQTTSMTRCHSQPPWDVLNRVEQTIEITDFIWNTAEIKKYINIRWKKGKQILEMLPWKLKLSLS